MIELIGDAILMLASFLFGMLWTGIVAAMAVADPKHGERRSAWFRRQIDVFDAERKRRQWRRQREER